ncbi:MAG TPA: DUF1697 domain-containing protein [Kofleriaceae bacterium]|nr:DUF1697 domain-containing protein [Kofleriaceae bacterium]
MTHVALLRGVNVGGKHVLPMALLAELFAAAGASEVRTFIQSGNVVFRATAAAAIANKVAAAIDKKLGFRPPIAVRSAAQLAKMIAANPFVRAGAPTDQLHVAFLLARPSARAIATLEPARFAPDAFAVVGDHVYLHYPNGVARTKLSNAYLDARLATTSTTRNWNTVRALHELAAGGR